MLAVYENYKLATEAPLKIYYLIIEQDVPALN